MSNGRIDINLDQTAVDEVMGLVEQIEQRIPFLLRLSNDEKARLVKPRAGTPQAVAAIAEIAQEAGMSPADGDPMLDDLSVYSGLTSLSDRLSDLLQRIEDTKLQAGSESWNACLIRYGMLRQLERNKPELKAKLDRVQPLIISRSRRSPGSATEPVEDPAQPETLPAE